MAWSIRDSRSTKFIIDDPGLTDVFYDTVKLVSTLLNEENLFVSYIKLTLATFRLNS